jgi:lipid II:glycine glycyltransferase (peptidoglycan interpeptide bridge formation enzyme)
MARAERVPCALPVVTTVDRPIAPTEPTASALESDAAAWDAFVAASSTPSHLQTSGWADVKRGNGWRAVRLAVGEGAALVGAQLLVLRPRPSPWAIGYVPRGPVIGGALDGESIGAVTERLRGYAASNRVASVVIEPEAEEGGPVEHALRQAGWRPAPHIQPQSSRLIDLTQSEAALWSDLRSSARWSVNKARRSGIRVVEGDASRVDEFHRLYAAAVTRAGIPARGIGAFRDMWAELAPRGLAHLLFAESEASGEPLATVFLVGCGPRIADLSSGTTPEGARQRANHLLKWEAFLLGRSWGYRQYDFYGVPREGIAEFKAAFGGREVHYVGAFEMIVDPLGHRLLSAAQALRRLQWRLLARSGRGSAESTEA